MLLSSFIIKVPLLSKLKFGYWFSLFIFCTFETTISFELFYFNNFFSFVIF